MLNILFLNEKNDTVFGEPYTQYEFEQTMGKYANCKYAGAGFPDYIAGESMDKTVKRVMPNVDWVIDDDKSYHIKKPENRKYKVGVFINDLHGKGLYDIRSPVEWGNMILKAEYDGVFMRTPLLYGSSYRPEVITDILGDKAHWVPNSVNTEKFYPRKEKKYDVAFIGAIYGCYPLRQRIYNDIFYVARGHKILRGGLAPRGVIKENADKSGDRCFVGDAYAEALGSTRILIFDCSIYRYPVLKFFEGGASGCLVMSDAPAMAERLGFIPRVTYTEIAAHNWEDGLKFFLENPSEVKKIAGPGMKMVRKYHSHEARGKQFVSMLEDNI